MVFQDTVDILVGWHIDHSQPITVTSFASWALQRLSRYWVADISFTLTMLSHFLEDTESYAEDLCSLANPKSRTGSPTNEEPLAPSSTEEALAKVTSFIK